MQFHSLQHECGDLQHVNPLEPGLQHVESGPDAGGAQQAAREVVIDGHGALEDAVGVGLQVGGPVGGGLHRADQLAVEEDGVQLTIGRIAPGLKREAHRGERGSQRDGGGEGGEGSRCGRGGW